MISKVTGAKYSVATINGTSALHAALLVAGANNETEIITQPLTFVATANAISYTGSKPIFIDVDKDTMGMSPLKLRRFLENNSKIIKGKCINKKTGKQILACVPMHTFGFPCRIHEIKNICDEFNISLIEDSAEGLGSKIKNKSVGTFGLMGVFSFNGNKIITTGGGGVIITNNPIIYNKIKHITNTSKVLGRDRSTVCYYVRNHENNMTHWKGYAQKYNTARGICEMYMTNVARDYDMSVIDRRISQYQKKIEELQLEKKRLELL